MALSSRGLTIAKHIHYLDMIGCSSQMSPLPNPISHPPDRDSEVKKWKNTLKYFMKLRKYTRKNGYRKDSTGSNNMSFYNIEYGKGVVIMSK